MRPHPHLYEINARLWLRRMNLRAGRPLTLASIPDEWLAATSARFDLVWLMGVWRRSAAGRREALTLPGLRSAYEGALPDWTPADVAGSPYAIPAYEIDPALGAPDELTRLRARLGAMGKGLIVDFVPNHLACDHPWTLDRPEWFVGGGEAELGRDPGAFYRSAGGAILAHGRDPNVPPWTDTVQVNFFSPALRAALIDELMGIAGQADGVRCDMAMLALNDVFERVWGPQQPGPRPPAEFWSEAIGAVKARYPGFLFIAEAYWDLEPQLIALGFDFAYDKRLYELLLGGGGPDIRQYLAASTEHSDRRLRFIENHDEPRAAVAFSRERGRAAAVAALTLPGLRLVHDGQMEGKRRRLPVQLVREPDEPPDPATRSFYDRLLAACDRPVFHEGTWNLSPVEPFAESDDTHGNVLAWTWGRGGQRALVVINYGSGPARARLITSEGDPNRWCDLLSDRRLVAGRGGMNVETGPWEVFILEAS